MAVHMAPRRAASLREHTSETSPAAAQRPAADPARSLQRSLGNRAVGRLLTGSAGAPVDAAIRRRVESATGTSLAAVRVHTDEQSQRAAAALQARAYTVGHDIHFGSGQYRPGDREGERLIAHELVHTIQQGGSAGAPQAKLAVSRPGDAGEREADSIADSIVDGGPVAPVRALQGPAVQRKILIGNRDVFAEMRVRTGGPAPLVPDPLEIERPLANAGAGPRNVRAMANDKRTRYFKSREELAEYAAARTTDIGYVDREKTWVRLPSTVLVLGESHRDTTLQDLVDATGNTRFKYEGKIRRSLWNRLRDRTDHSLEPDLPKMVVGLHGVRDALHTKEERSLYSPIQSATDKRGTTDRQKDAWKRKLKREAREEQEKVRPTPAQQQREYEADLATWSEQWELKTEDRLGARSTRPGINGTLANRAPERPYDRNATERAYALKALRYLQERPFRSGDLRNFYAAHVQIVDETVDELSGGSLLKHTTMFRKMITGRFSLDRLISLFEQHAMAQFARGGHEHVTENEDYEMHYERAARAGRDGNDHGLRMEQLRDSYMLASMRDAANSGIRLFGLGEGHRKNLRAILRRENVSWVVCDSATFYAGQYALHPDV